MTCAWFTGFLLNSLFSIFLTICHTINVGDNNDACRQWWLMNYHGKEKKEENDYIMLLWCALQDDAFSSRRSFDRWSRFCHKVYCNIQFDQMSNSRKSKFLFLFFFLYLQKMDWVQFSKDGFTEVTSTHVFLSFLITSSFFPCSASFFHNN